MSESLRGEECFWLKVPSGISASLQDFTGGVGVGVGFGGRCRRDLKNDAAERFSCLRVDSGVFRSSGKRGAAVLVGGYMNDRRSLLVSSSSQLICEYQCEATRGIDS
jgi:hypothetical protein